MGWLRYMFLGDLGQQLDIHESRERLDAMRRSMRGKRHKDARQDARLDALEGQIDQLELLVSALVRRLVEKGVLTQGELESVVRAIDPDEQPPTVEPA